jgi:hypothetical protein
LRVIKDDDQTPLDSEFWQLQALGSVALLMQPQTKGVQRGDVGVARDGANASSAQSDDELLECRLGRQRGRISGNEPLVILERDLIPDDGPVGHVFEIPAFGEKLLEERGQRVVHGELQTLWGKYLLAKELAPQAGLEPATLRLTAGCSAIELLRNRQVARNGEPVV